MSTIAPLFPSHAVFPQELSLTFAGFEEKAFALLKKLRENPHIEAYKEHKEPIEQYIKAPFKQFRDDLVLNWVLPNGLPYETERNVFSRLLKNDFGAGGCHHHMWLSFYRIGTRRLKDLQIAFTIRDTGFGVSLYAGDNAPDLLKEVKSRINNHPEEFLVLSNSILSNSHWDFYIRPKSSVREERLVCKNPLNELPAGVSEARSIWWSSHIPARNVIQMGDQLLGHVLDSVGHLWPMYLFLLNIP